MARAGRDNWVMIAVSEFSFIQKDIQMCTHEFTCTVMRRDQLVWDSTTLENFKFKHKDYQILNNMSNHKMLFDENENFCDNKTRDNKILVEKSYLSWVYN